MKKNIVPLSLAGLSLTAAMGVAHAEAPTALLGDVVPVSEASRTVVITPQTRYVNVNEGDVLAFKTAQGEFAVRFDGASSVMSFDLQRLAPAGVLDHPVQAYVAWSPLNGGV